MSFLELLLILLLLAVCLLQVFRRVGLPYPTMLAGAGVLVALVPGMPAVAIDPATALTIFIAPALVAAAYEFPLREAAALRAPLFAFAVVAVVLTTAAVGAFALAAGLPLVAALALGAIVAPPDAAAATAVLSTLRLPRATDTLIRGESLFNDAAALLLFEGVLTVGERGTLDSGTILALAAAAPLGVAIGVASGFAACQLYGRLSGTLGETLLQFVVGMLVWVAATHVGASAALAVVVYALVVAHCSRGFITAQVRVHSSAVWNTAVFVLNVAAFLLMGMQARAIVTGLPSTDRLAATAFAAGVLLIVIAVRLVVVIGFNRLNAAWRRHREREAPGSLRQATLVAWTGMRGLVTLAAALALPPTFPMRATVVLAAFGVVLGTLVIQGATLTALVRRLGLVTPEDRESEYRARRRLADAGARRVSARPSAFSEQLNGSYAVALGDAERLAGYRTEALDALSAERRQLHDMVRTREIDGDLAASLEQELDFRELSLRWAEDRRIVEG